MRSQLSQLRALFIGEGTLLVRCAEAFVRAGHEIVAVIAAEPRIAVWAAGMGIACAAPTQDLGADITALTSGQAFDYLFSVANMRVLSADVLALPRLGAVNYHDALLPAYAGAHATSWAIMNGERTHGVTWHEMLERVDSGRILKQRPLTIAPDETAVSLNARCYEAGIELFAELVDELASGRVTYADPHLEVRSYFPLYKRPAHAAVLRWEASAEELSALARALDFGPSPNPLGLPKIDLGHEILLAPQVEVLPTVSGAPPGTVLAVDEGGPAIATATSDVRLPRVLTVTGRVLSTLEQARLGLRPGVCLGSPPLAGATENVAGAPLRAA